MNLGTLRTDIVTTLEESLRILSQTGMRYLVLAFLAYLLSVYLCAVRWQLHKSLIVVLLLSSGVWVLDVVRLKLIALALNGIVEGGLISILLYFGLPLTSASSFVFITEGLRYGKAQSCTDQ